MRQVIGTYSLKTFFGKAFFPLSLFLTWRGLLFIPLLAGEMVTSYRAGYDYTNVWKFIVPYTPVSSFLLYPWANFDGVHYLLIASQGYTNNFGFFPLFPFTIHALSSLFGKGSVFGPQQFFSGFFITNFSFAIALVLFYKLLKLDYKKSVSQQTLIFLLLFPTSFFFGAIYAESLFFLLLVASFYLARKQKWALSNTLGALLTLTRPVGICLFPALLWEYWKHTKSKNLFNLLSFLLMPAALGGYAVFNWIYTKNPLYFLETHGNLANGRAVDTIVLIPQTIFRYTKILTLTPNTYHEWWVALLEVTTFVIVSTLLVIAWKKRVRTSYLIFSILAFLIPALSGTFTGLPRYALVVFAAFIGLALIDNKWIRMTYYILSPILLFLLLILFSKGYYVS